MPKKSTKKIKKIKRANRWSLTALNPARTLMFILTFAIIGIWYLIATKANTEYNVRFVYFCTEKCSGSTQAEIDTLGNQIQAWYRNQLGGRTFNKLPTVQVQGRYASSHYSSLGTGENYRTYNTLLADPNLAPYFADNTKTVVVLGFRALNNCGAGVDKLAMVDPHKGCSSIKSAVMAHELGHTLNLPGYGVPKDPYHTNDGTLMSQNIACQGKGLSNCNLSQTHKNFLLNNNPWFGVPNPAPTGGLDSATCSQLSGWAVDTSDSKRSIDVRIYVGGPANSGAPGFNLGPASQPRADVNRVHNVPGNHGYSWTVPNQFRNGKTYRIWAYAVDIPGGNLGVLAQGNGEKSITCNVKSSVGVYRSATGGQWFFQNDINTATYGGSKFGGQKGDVPVVGDWDGDGKDTAGIFRPSTGEWFLRNDLAGGNPHYGVFKFGTTPGDVPVTGDWDGDGKDTVGIYRPKTGQWFFQNSLGGTTFGGFSLGTTAGDMPVTGDWNGDGKDGIGIYRPKTGEWFLRNELAGGTNFYAVFKFGTTPGDIPVVGDWNGDGKDTPGIYRTRNAAGKWGTWYLSNQLSGNPPFAAQFDFGTQSGDLPVVGNWKGN